MNKSEPKHIYAENKIREAISHLKIGDKLSGERVLAKELGISYMTARRAVDNLVAKGILQKVPKKGAFVASLRETPRKAIGYFLDSSIKDGLSSPYYSLVFDALEKEATKHGYSLMYCSDFDDSLAKMEKIDGAIISCFPRIENIVQHVRKLVPVVCIDNCSPDKSIPSITIDNLNSVVDSTSHLLALGHERIGFITGLDDSDIGRNRLAGYTSAMNSCGIGIDMDLVYKGDYSYETGIIAADYFLSLDKPPTAIMCANDIMAIGAIKEISRRKLSVPADISVVGFDDVAISAQMTPALTTVSAPIRAIAEHSVNMLNMLITGIEPDNRHISLPGKLVARDSCAAHEHSTPANRKQKAS